MKITRKSPFTCKTNTMDIDVTNDQLAAWRDGASIQVAMPHLTPDEREFIKNGITSSEWEEMFAAVESGVHH
jgi:hypothetical protein